MVHKLAEEGVKKSAEKLFDAGGDLLAEKIKAADGNLEAAYREALRLSLATLRPQIGGDYQDWFEHWELCLRAKETLRLDKPGPDQLALTKIDSVLLRTMVRLDAQGAMMRQNRPSITLVEREMPEELDAVLAQYLPEIFDDSFKTLIVSDEYGSAYRFLMLLLQRASGSAIVRVESNVSMLPQIAADMADLPQKVSAEIRQAAAAIFEQNAQQGRVTSQEYADKDALIAWQAQELFKLQQQLAKRVSEPLGIRLEQLVQSGDLETALQVKREQLRGRELEAAKRPRDYFELGKIHELRFEWVEALEAYRQAWRLEPSWDNGFQYAYLAQKQNRYKEAVTVYEATRLLSADVESTALTLNNLAILYSDTQRMGDAELAYGEALATYRQLAKQNPEAYLPDVAMTLNNLAILYSDTQRMGDAELAYGEALATYRQLAEQNPEAYLPDVAMTLNNLAILYSDTQRMRDAEQAFGEALATYRQLAEQNPEAYLPDVAMTLNNLAILYSDTQREDEGLRLCREAVSILRPLWNDNPAVHGNQMARILWAIADLLGANSEEEACKLAREALSMAYDPGVKEGIERSIARWCGEGEADSRRE